MPRLSENEEKSERSSTLPSRFVPVGGLLTVAGVEYVAVPRPKVPYPRLVCSGCGLRSRYCTDLACSRSDRLDGVSVWFVPAE